MGRSQKGRGEVTPRTLLTIKSSRWILLSRLSRLYHLNLLYLVRALSLLSASLLSIPLAFAEICHILKNWEFPGMGKVTSYIVITVISVLPLRENDRETWGAAALVFVSLTCVLQRFAYIRSFCIAE